MSDNVTALTCPNCGGSVDVPSSEGTPDSHSDIVKCPYCGTTLELPERQEPPPAAKFEPAIDAQMQERMQEAMARRSAAKPSRGASMFSIIITIIILAGIGIGIAAAFGPIISGPSLSLYDGVVPLLPAESGTPDLVAVVRQGDEDNIRLAVLDGKTRQTHWVSSESYTTDSGHLAPVPGGNRIYFLDGNNLMAYKTADGKLAWQKTLANGVDSSCKDCVRLVGGQLMVLSKDGTLQALNPASGVQTWSVSLNSSPRQLLLAAGKPAVVDLDSNKDNTLLIYDPQTGKIAQQFGAGCLATGPGMVKGQGLEDVYLSPDGSLAYLMYFTMGFQRPPCAQQVDLATGKVNWTTTPTDGQTWPNAWFASQVLVSDQGVFFYEDNSLSLIDARTGTLHLLFKEPRYRDVTPLASQAGWVAVLAIPDFDSESKELWGIDTASGKKLWTYKMQAKSIIDPWRVQLTSVGLVVVQCLGDAKVSQWEVLDPLTGASQGMKQITDQNYNFLEDAWTSTTAYLKIDNTLYTMDVKTGTVEYTWP